MATYFRVQLAAFPEPIVETDERWASIEAPVELVYEGQLYKYQVGQFSSVQEATQLKDQLRRKGFLDAFIVAYQGGKRISIQEAQGQLAQP